VSVSAAEKLQRTAERDAELRRFLYVTMTRSKSLLIVPDSAGFYRDHAARKPNFASLSSWDPAHVPKEFPFPQKLPLLPRGEDPPPPPEPAPRVVAADSEKWQASARISQFIPTGTSPTRHKQPIDADDLPPEEPAPLLVGIGGKDYGTWWHDTLQQFPWRGIDARRAEYVARTVSEIPANAEWRDRGQEELKRFADSKTCRDIITTGKFFLPEIPFSHAVAGEPPTWIEGILDLLILSADGPAWIVDWKTDRLREGESPDNLLARLRESYTAQLNAYAVAIEAAGRAVARRTIYSTVLGSAIDC
jgi:ATP-dependent exoDNAse (exonuclease V) beta subunit